MLLIQREFDGRLAVHCKNLELLFHFYVERKIESLKIRDLLFKRWALLKNLQDRNDPFLKNVCVQNLELRSLGIDIRRNSYRLHRCMFHSN